MTIGRARWHSIKLMCVDETLRLDLRPGVGHGSRFRAGEGLPAAARETPIDEVAGERGGNQQKSAHQPFVQGKLTDRKHTAVNQGAAHEPVERVGGEIADWCDFWSEGGDVFPSVNGGADTAIELDQLGFGFRLSD